MDRRDATAREIRLSSTASASKRDRFRRTQLNRRRTVERITVGKAIPMVTTKLTVIPPCPKCNCIDHVEAEEQSGSSASWFLCARCGSRFIAPPKR